jgi:hypothetical protein
MTTDPVSRNGGIVSTLGNLGQSIVATLPPAFLILVLLNLGFLGLVFHFLDDVSGQRTILLQEVLHGCIAEMRK